MVLKNIEQSLILVSDFIGYVSISTFALLVCIPIGITSSAVGVKTCALTAGTKMHKSTIFKSWNKCLRSLNFYDFNWLRY